VGTGRAARPAVAARKEEGQEGEEGHGRFLFLFFLFFLRKFLFFVKSVNGEKSKTKPNWNGPKFLGCPKVSTKI
jgi:hypothetical protein